MTTRNFDALFEPACICLVGASERAGSVGDVLARNLLAGGFAGTVLFLNREGGQVHGRAAYRTAADLPSGPDLAVIATPAASVPGLIADLGARGCRAAVVISAGFEGEDATAARLRQATLDAARPHLLRIVGPNCLGMLSPAPGVNASFARRAPPPGGLALVAQSGAVAAAALDWAPAHGLGFSHVVTLGDALDVDAADLLDHLGRDPVTQAILLYIESLTNARKFMSAARAAARVKPVICLKGGRSREGAAAAFSHTRALAGADDVYSAALRRAGVLQVETLDEMLDLALLYAGGRPPCAGALAILTNGGGAGVLAVDALEREGGRLAQLAEGTQAALQAVAPAHGVWRNPVDILGDAGPERYAASLGVLLAAPEVDAVLTINCPTAVADSTAAAEAVVSTAHAQGVGKTLLAAWLGEPSVAAGRRRLIESGVASFPTAEAAVRAYARLGDADRVHSLLLEVPEGDERRDLATARRIVETALTQGRPALEPMEAQALLRAYGLELLSASFAPTPDAAGELAAGLGPGARVALKLQSPDITHKSDVGGVVLGLSGRTATARAARRMLRQVAKLHPEARIQGFLVQPMASRPNAQEVLAGLVRDPTFGPVVVVGHGGVAVEVIADRALGLPPLNAVLARDMVSQTRVARLLAGYRDRPPADGAALECVLVALGQLATDLPEVAELDLNPVLCDASGALVLDARVAIRRPIAGARPAILPYPGGLTHQIVAAGEPMTIRAVRPSDGPRIAALADACTPEDVRRRFGGGRLHLDAALVAQLSQLDYDRHIALAAEAADGSFLGVGRLVEDREGDSAEFALLVRSDHKRRGLGRALLGAVLHYARNRGLSTVWGDVARDNTAMMGLAHALGFRSEPKPSDLSRAIVSLALETMPAADRVAASPA